MVMDNEDPKVVFISGASSGIGEASALRLSKAGYAVILGARRIERLDSLASQINTQGGQALPVYLDLTQAVSIHAACETSLAQFGKVDILINNAGFGRLGWLENLNPIADVEALVRVNLIGLIQLTREFIPGMLTRKQGHIINISSVAGYVAFPAYSVYAATKFGVRGFTDSLRREVKKPGVYVSGIYPGSVDTEFKNHTGLGKKLGYSTPARLRLSAEQVAEVVYRCVQKPRSTIVIPRYLWLAIWLNRFLPGLVDRFFHNSYTKQEGLEK
jgi:short-subunit dehydrogenase